ncbi:dolichyl-P-Man:Man(7)GlcNAc(2)-PP-dolichol alpha-1,6-mannosyltransferase [Entomortierella beljakovae]|nr:dolichyl-P-Man:Man(7)GlcNAc(2)-PP-dolichol alpha-1,6-mannosyltransferase [Entomortierella beljakovae]
MEEQHSNGLALQNGHQKMQNGNGLNSRKKTVRFQTEEHSRSSSTDSIASISASSITYTTNSVYLTHSASTTSSITNSQSSITGVEYLARAVVLLLIFAHILVAPFTKVEESFNLQATHDILTFGVSGEGVKKFDHLEFPGAVPRTFVGPLLLAMISWPIMALARLIGVGAGLPKGLIGQVIGWHRMSIGVRYQFGKMTSLLFLLVSSVQFHWLFYAGRTLPNTFALAIVNVAFSYWMKASSQSSRTFTERQLMRMIDCLVASTVLFRSELLLLLGPIVLLELSMTRIRLLPTILEGIKAGVASLAVAVAIDSWFWRQWMWAEGAVFWFNAVQGKSVAWGVSPWHTYFSTLLPKISGVALPLALIAVVIEPRYRRYILPAGFFVGLYSFLGHKEWRFVIYVVPILNLGAAIALSWIIKRKTLGYRLMTVILFGVLGLNFLLSIGQSLISSLNYPGGVALQRLHELELNHFTAAHVHIDGAAAEAGCSRFGEIGSQITYGPWTYSKDESHITHQDYLKYTHLLTSKPDFHRHDFIILEQVDGYAGIAHIPLGHIKESCPSAVSRLVSNVDSYIFSIKTLEELWDNCSPLKFKKEGQIWILRRFGAV